MRGLKHGIPQDMKDSLDASPFFQWFVLLLILAVGALLVLKGVNGFKNKRITGKYGRVYEGTTAEIFGVVFIAVGSMMALVSIAFGVASLVFTL